MGNTISLSSSNFNIHQPTQKPISSNLCKNKICGSTIILNAKRKLTIIVNSLEAKYVLQDDYYFLACFCEARFLFGWLKTGTSTLSRSKHFTLFYCKERWWCTFDFHKSIDISAFCIPRVHLFFKNDFKVREMKVFFRICVWRKASKQIIRGQALGI